MKKMLFFFALLLTLVGCSKSDSVSGDGQYTVKVLKSEGVTLTVLVAVFDGKTDTETLNKPLTEDYVKTYDVKEGNIAVAISAEGSSETSTLRVQLLKGDKVIKESTSKGEILSANISN